MKTLLWTGPPPPRGTVAALRAGGIEVRTGRAGEGIQVIATRGRPLPPAAPGGALWIWVSAVRVSQEALTEAVRRGAYDVLSMSEAGWEARLVRRAGELLEPAALPPKTPGIVAESESARRMLEQVARVARTNMPVLLAGETGTGKEEMAGLIHRWSGRSGPYVPINCAAVPNELMESELFGHVKGAFSGAVASVDGRLVAAQGGTVFLDEIDDTPLPTQVKLLRVLEDGEITRVGETRARKVDFRIVAATNRDLTELIARGRFGQDLYERLAIVTVRLPRLAERKDDVPALTRHFIGRFYERLGEPPRVTTVSPSALAGLMAYPWPGNIRELRNVVYQALVYKRSGDELLLSDLRRVLDPPPERRRRGLLGLSEAELEARIRAGTFNLRRERKRLESAALRVALRLAGGQPARAARLLGEVGRGRSTDPGGTVRAMMRRLLPSRAEPDES